MTRLSLLAAIAFGSFNPHTHVGCDTTACLPYHVTGSFNPHTHVGCDAVQGYKDTETSCFNPHTHVGCDSDTSGNWDRIV